jgi:transposase
MARNTVQFQKGLSEIDFDKAYGSEEHRHAVLVKWRWPDGFVCPDCYWNSIAVSREHRRAKTDRLDTELLKRAFLGWLRREPDHCSMAMIPTIAEEDARHPNRERENLVGQRTRIVNRMKACLARFGIRNFKPTLRKASERLEALTTPEGGALRRFS